MTVLLLELLMSFLEDVDVTEPLAEAAGLALFARQSQRMTEVLQVVLVKCFGQYRSLGGHF